MALLLVAFIEARFHIFYKKGLGRLNRWLRRCDHLTVGLTRGSCLNQSQGRFPMSMQMAESRNLNSTVIAFIVEKATIVVLLGAACTSLFAIMTGTGSDLPMLLT